MLNDNFSKYFFDTKNIEHYLDRYLVKIKTESKYQSNQVDVYGLTIDDFLKNAPKIIKLVLQQIKDNSYEVKPAKLQNIFFDKIRPYVKFSIIDRWLINYFGYTYYQHAENKFLQCLFSFRKNYSYLMAINEVAYEIKQNEKLYCVQADVKSYSDNMNHDFLIKDFKRFGTQNELIVNLFKKILNFKYYEDDIEKIKVNKIGSPLGTYLTLVMSNLYLYDLDYNLSQLAGKYLRYGDDIIFLSKDYKLIEQARHIIKNGVEQRKLPLHDEYLLDRELSRGPLSKASSIYYLGRVINNSGEIILPGKRFQSFRKQLKYIIKGYISSLENPLYDDIQKVSVIVKKLGFLLSNPRGEIQTVLEALFEGKPDLVQLKQLDNWMNLIILSLVMGKKHNKSNFRDYKVNFFRKLGLPSFVHLYRTKLKDRER